MQQVFVIHGGMTFDSYEEYCSSLRHTSVTLEDLKRKGWKDGLQAALGEAYDVLAPRFPNAFNARYLEWKIWFDKYVPLLDDNIILVGHSLGGIFLAKYLSEEDCPKKIRATMLVAAPYDIAAAEDESFADFVLEGSLVKCAAQGGHIFLYHSMDDAVVPFANVERYRAELPDATVRTFTNRGHFNTEYFPELVADIENLS